MTLTLNHGTDRLSEAQDVSCFISTRANAGSPTIVHVLLSESPFFFLFLISQSCVWQVGEKEKERNNHYTTITYTSNNTRTEEIYGLPADRLFVLCELRPIATIYIPGCCTITTKALGVHQVACQPTLPLPSSRSPPSEDWGAALLAGVSISITMGRPSVSLKHPSISSITRLLHNGRRQRHECARRKTILALACPYRVFCPSQIAHFNLVAFAFHYNRNHFSFCLQELQTNLLLAAYVFFWPAFWSRKSNELLRSTLLLLPHAAGAVRR